jgi:hypothetical protein
MAFDPTNFLYSLAKWIASRTSLVVGTHLFVGRAIGAGTIGLQNYAGTGPWNDPMVIVRVQAAALNREPMAALSLLYTLFNACLNTDGSALCGVQIPYWTFGTTAAGTTKAYVLKKIQPLDRPASVGMATDSLCKAVWNFEIAVCEIAI